jgi:GTPase SAR1 family protein
VTTSVERPVTIAVAGTHSTGKTTFIARLAHELRRDKITVAHVADLGEDAMSLGLPLLDNHAWASTCVAGRRTTSAPQGLEARVGAIINSTGTTNDTAEYRRWAPVVARYSFRTLDL